MSELLGIVNPSPTTEVVLVKFCITSSFTIRSSVCNETVKNQIHVIFGIHSLVKSVD